MRLGRRGLLAWGAGAAAVASLSACGGNSSDSETAGLPSASVQWRGAKSTGDGTLSLLSDMYADENQKNAYRDDVISPFFSGTGYSMDTSYTSTEKLPDKIITALTAGKLADVVTPHQGWVQAMQRYNAVDEMPSDILDGLNLDQRLMTGCYWDDKLLALPYALDLTVIGYRVDMFAEAGIASPPSTLDELREMAKLLNRADERGGFDVFGGGVVNLWAMLVGSYGGSLFTDEGGVAFNEDAGMDALNFMIGLVQDGSANPDKIPTGGAQPLFIQQTTAMSPMSSTLWSALQGAGISDDAHLGFFALPSAEKDNDPVVLQTGSQLAVSRLSSHRDVALEFCQNALQTDPLLSAVSLIPAIAPRSDAMVGSDLTQNRVMSAGLANVPYATASLGGSPCWFDLQPVIEGQLMAAIRGTQSSEMAIRNLERTANDSLGRNP